MSSVHVIVPDGFDDPARPSGGNAYDRRISCGLGAIGWSVHVRVVPGSWPWPDAAARGALASVYATIPDGGLVLLDGLIASTLPEVVVPEAGRLREVVLVHMPLGEGQPGRELAEARTKERAVLSAAAAVVTTSTWTRSRLLGRYALPPAQVHVAEPGVDAADLAPGTATGGELLCVAAVARHKGHDVLLDALATITELAWRCTCVGALDREPGFGDRLARHYRIGDRVHFAGPRSGADLRATYAAADVLVLASRAETYAMVVTEALACGLPVIATSVGGLPQALGRGADGTIPGLLVPPGDPAALAAALRRWLGDTVLRRRLRAVARERRATLSDWSATAARISRILDQVAA
ncbi:MAG: glycosyltransferase family 4 protein [Jatrophihabitantaceae bacterium]